MSWLKLLVVVLVLGVTATVAPAQARPPVDISGWKTFRDDAMGFEVKHPPGWNVARSTGTLEGILLGKPRQAGEEQVSLQFFVQRDLNPNGLTIEQWYADQLRKIRTLPSRTTDTVIGGRPTIRMENTNTMGRHFMFFTALDKSDIFTISIIQPSPREQLDRTYDAILSTVRFLP
ncbi:MAG TPA: hypothetical protein VGW35_15475 [Methylomirabilota bacterium]|nr:hypothetical protein [Methylomirabilota bacterium]